MTGTELRDRLEGLGWTQRHLANVLGVTARTVNRWVRGLGPVPVYVSAYVKTMRPRKVSAK